MNDCARCGATGTTTVVVHCDADETTVTTCARCVIPTLYDLADSFDNVRTDDEDAWPTQPRKNERTRSRSRGQHRRRH